MFVKRSSKAIGLALILVLGTGNLLAQTNVALNKDVYLIGTGFFSGNPNPPVDPRTIVDGVFLPPFSPWNQGTVWWLDWECRDDLAPCAIEIDLGGAHQINAFIFQADSDTHLLEYHDRDLKIWQLAWQVPNTGGAVQTRPSNADTTQMHVIPSPVITDRLRVSLALGLPGTDGYAAISEVQAYGVPYTPPDHLFCDSFEDVACEAQSPPPD